MRFAWMTVIALGSLAQSAQQGGVAVGIWYAGPAAKPPVTRLSDPNTIARDLTVIKRAGFNAITTWVTWADAQPEPDVLQIDGTEQLIAAAAASGLQVAIRLYVLPAPRWSARAADPSPARFIEAVRSRLAGRDGVTSIRPVAPDDAASAAAIAVGGSGGLTPAEARLAFWTAVGGGARSIYFLDSDGGIGPHVLSLGETAGIVTRNLALFDPLRPRRDRALPGAVTNDRTIELRLMESADAIMIIGLNRSAVPRTATITFPPEIPEAIWQNLETGTAVHFVMGARGPVLEHTFAPHDTLVLMIRTRLR